MYCLPTGLSGILNTEEESLTKLKSICTNQLSAVNLPHGLQDNLSQQKALVDERLKLLQDQKLLFQVLSRVHNKCIEESILLIYPCRRAYREVLT